MVRRGATIGFLAFLFALTFGVTAQNSYMFEPIGSASAQENLHSNHADGQRFEPMIDGSIQPGDVPDNVAIRALMQTLRIPTNPDGEALERLHARVDRVGLSDVDIEILVQKLAVFEAEIASQHDRIQALRPSSETVDRETAARYVEEQVSLGYLIRDHYEDLLVSLSSEGREKMQNHLSYVKSRIKIYPVPDMSQRDDETGGNHGQP